MKKRYLLIILLAILTIGADQATKWWARSTLKGAPAKVIVPDYFSLEYHENPGSAFGMFRNFPYARYLLIGVGVIALILVWTMIQKVEKRKTIADIAFALVAGGAIGNQVDRIYIGRVVDFILMHWQRKYFWPAYNVADTALVVGVILLILVMGRKPEAATAVNAKTKSKKSNR